MVKGNDVRDLVISHSESGKKAPEIAKMLVGKVHRSTVDRWIQRYKQSGSIGVQKKSGRPRTARTKRLINLVNKRLNSKIPRKSLRTMAKDFNTSLWTVRRVLNEDLHKKILQKNQGSKTKGRSKVEKKEVLSMDKKKHWLRQNKKDHVYRRKNIH
jgi:transposase